MLESVPARPRESAGWAQITDDGSCGKNLDNRAEREGGAMSSLRAAPPGRKQEQKGMLDLTLEASGMRAKSHEYPKPSMRRTRAAFPEKSFLQT